ncbi:MAG: ABC transporter ATP-binding protein [Myxococcota bacterium]|nr:ABC transporter ATP-binding protein [Myxococcota bacterium]
MTSGPILETHGLSKSFAHRGQTIDVLRGIDLTVNAGDQLAIVGQSGAGKSTLLHVLGTLDSPSSGQILYEGVDVFALGPKKIADFRNRTIGFIFQFHHLLAEFTALENVMMPRLIMRETRAVAEAQAKGLLDAVGLSHRLTHRPSELSGGEQQRVALARALVNRPKLLMADEPTGNLDGKTSGQIHALFNQINEEFGTAMVIVTHNRSFAASMPKRLEMLDGALVDESTVT